MSLAAAKLGAIESLSGHSRCAAERALGYLPATDSGDVMAAQDLSQAPVQSQLDDEREAVDVISAVGQTVAGELDLHKLVQSVVDAATRLTRAEFGAFFYNVINRQSESYVLYAISGVPRSAFEKFPLPRNTEIFEPTFRGTGIVRCDDVTKDPRYGKSAPYHGMPAGHLPVRSYLAVPVVARNGEVLGGLFFGAAKVGVFNERHERLVKALASLAAIGIENVRLVEQLTIGRDRMDVVLRTANVGLWFCPLPFDKLIWDERVKAHFHLAADANVDIDLFYERLHADDRQRTREAIERSVSQREHYDIDYRTVSPDGLQTKWIRAIGRAYFDSEGNPFQFDGITVDVTDRKRAEAEKELLLASERAARSDAERASRMKDEFLATLSHELRTPLNAILGWSQILNRQSNSPSAVANGLQVIERNARAQAQIIDDLLDMSRIISGRVRLDVQRVNVAPILEAAIEAQRPAADAKGIRMQSVLDPLAGPVSGDPGRLQQIFWNLIGNAVKFTPKGGRVQIVLERVNSHLEISVIDNGEGIRPEFLPNVFDRFRQADPSTTRKHGGLGLGLAIVKQLVELHGGTVKVKSGGEGKGATFTVSLPVIPIHPEPDASRRHPTSAASPSTYETACDDLNGVRILVIDDEPDARALLERLLEDCSAVVTTAASADEAIERLREAPFDVIVSDIGMPGEDGYSLINRVRQLAARQRTPAVALTAYARSEDRTRSILAGFDMHIAKPVEPAELIATVASLAKRSRGNPSQT